MYLRYNFVLVPQPPIWNYNVVRVVGVVHVDEASGDMHRWAVIFKSYSITNSTETCIHDSENPIGPEGEATA